MRPFTVYLILRFCASLLFSMIFTVNMLYQVTVVELSPFQLVLIGTTLEASVFLFEVPTGLLADVKSRRLSVIIGYAVMGLGFLVEGAFAVFGAVALAQVLWGLGYTFTSGASEAWIADEVGEDRAGDAFLRGSQAAQAASLVGIPLSVAIGTLGVRLPILVGGGLLIGLALFLALTMTEEGFSPTPPEHRTTWGMMRKTVDDARQLVRRQPVVLALLAISFFYGLYSEGFDRLWTPHLLDNFDAPLAGAVQPVVWFGALRGVLAVVSLAATEFVRLRVDVNPSSRAGPGPHGPGGAHRRRAGRFWPGPQLLAGRRPLLAHWHAAERYLPAPAATGDQILSYIRISELVVLAFDLLRCMPYTCV